MPTAALPIVSGTVRTASLLSDNRTGDQPETPFAALLDTGTGPQIQKTQVRTDKPQRRDTTTATAAPASSKPAPTKPAKDAATETQPASTEATTDVAPKAKDAADTGDKPVDANTDGETSAEGDGTEIDPSAMLDGAAATDVLAAPATTTTPTPVAVAVQAVTTGIVSDGESAPTPEADVVVATVAGITPEAPVDNSETIAAPIAAGGSEEQLAALANKAEVKSEAKTDTVETDAPVDAKPVEAKITEQPKAADAGIDNSEDIAKLDTTSTDPDAEPVKSELHASPENKSAAKPSAEATVESSANGNANAATGPRADAPTLHTLRPDIASPLQNGPLPGTHTVAQHAGQMQMQAPAVAAAVPLTGIAVEIASQAKDGKNRFEIRLDPPELGRIDVRLDVDGQGNVTSRLLVERQDTLDLLRRDSTALERALNDAGLKTSNDGLQFSLRDQGANADQQRNEMSGRTARVVVPTETGSIADPSLYRAPRLGALDIRV